jgi:tRNA(Arg) A34 adenosine deaminase TadA
MRFPDFVLRLPVWVEDMLPDPGMVYETDEDRMRLVVSLAQLNVDHGTGGPFGAAVFDLAAHTLLAPGVNLVVPAHCSVLHAEIVATILAQQIAGHFDLGGPGMPSYELVTSTEPCAMCMGSIPWSGVRRLVCGARDEDARRVGFDEGPKAANWVDELEHRGISVVRDVCRDEAADILCAYAQSGGPIYNARQKADRTLHRNAGQQ